VRTLFAAPGATNISYIIHQPREIEHENLPFFFSFLKKGRKGDTIVKSP